MASTASKIANWKNSLPLLDHVTTDLPANSKAPELDDTHATFALKADAKASGEDLSAGGAVTQDTVGVYIAYLVQIGFMPEPPGTGEKSLPLVRIDEAQRTMLTSVGGRTGAA